MKKGIKKRLFAVVLATILVMGICGSAVSVFAAASGNQTVKTSLNMRSSMEIKSNNVVLVIPSGGTVSIVSAESNNWYKVTYSGKTGYIKGGYFGTPTKSSTSSKSSTTTKVMVENLNMRSSMDKSTPDNIMMVIAKGKTVTILNQESNGWYKISYRGKTGYIMGGHFTDDTSRVGAKDAEATYADLTVISAANFRTKPNGEIISVIPANTKVNNLTREGNWYVIRYKGKVGYVHKSLVK